MAAPPPNWAKILPIILAWMLNPPKEVPIILKFCQHNWDKPTPLPLPPHHTKYYSQFWTSLIFPSSTCALLFPKLTVNQTTRHLLLLTSLDTLIHVQYITFHALSAALYNIFACSTWQVQSRCLFSQSHSQALVHLKEGRGVCWEWDYLQSSKILYENPIY